MFAVVGFLSACCVLSLIYLTRLTGRVGKNVNK